MKISSLLFIVLTVVLGVSLLSIWFYPSVQDFMESNTMWNGITDFSGAFGATNLGSLEDLPKIPENSMLVAIPYLDYSDQELFKMRTFIEDGGTLLLMDDFGYGNTILRFLDVPARFNHALLLDPLFCYRNQTMPKITDFAPALKEENINLVVFNHGTALDNVGQTEALAWSSSMSFLDLNGNEELDPDETRGPFVVAAEYRLGKGTIELVSDPSVLVNAMVGRDDNHAFITHLVKEDAEKTLMDPSHIGQAPLDVSKVRLNVARQVLSNPYGLLAIVASIFAITTRYMLKREETG